MRYTYTVSVAAIHDFTIHLTDMSRPVKGGVILPIRLAPKAHKALRKAARRRGLPLSTYMREVALEDATRENEATDSERETAPEAA